MDDKLKYILIFIGVALAVFLILTLLSKLIGTICSIILSVILVAVIFTVVFGNGRGIVHTFSSFFNDDIGTQIEEGYEIYKSREEEESYFDTEKIEQSATEVFQNVTEQGKALFD